MWKLIQAFNIKPMYQINTFGEIRNIYTMKKLKPYTDKAGYYKIVLQTFNGPKNFLIHRLVAYMFIGPNPENKKFVNHKNADKADEFYSNLEWVTASENIIHAYKNNLINLSNCICEDKPTARLTNEQVHQICSCLQDGLSHKDILSILGFEYSDQNIKLLSKIKSRKNYTAISKKYTWNDKMNRDGYMSHDDSLIHSICQLFQEGKSNKEICNILKLRFRDQRIKNLLYRIHHRKQYNEISKNYNW